jgi:hypothetical protein
MFIIIITILLFFILKPNILLNLYNNIYGKIILVLLLILFSAHTIYFGITLLIIILLVIHWENKKPLESLENFNNKVNHKTIHEDNINVNKRIDEFTPLNSKHFNVVKQSSNNTEPFISSSLLKNSRSLII